MRKHCAITCWLKTLAYEGGRTCTGLLAQNTNYQSAFYSKPFSSLPRIFNNTFDANFSQTTPGQTVAGVLKRENGGAILLESVASNQSPSSLCYGNIVTINDTPYCITYSLPKGGLELTNVEAGIDGFNLSAISLVNASDTAMINGQLTGSINLIKMLNLTGQRCY